MDYNESDTCWHLMVTTRGGAVSMLQNLDASTARQAYRSLRPNEHPTKHINAEGLSSWSSSGFRVCNDSDIASVKIIGPEGAKLEPWRGVEPRIIDMAPEQKRQRQYRAEAEVKRHKADELAADVGALKELRPQINDAFRCAECSKMQPNGSLLYYVPDGVRKTDDPELVREIVERHRFNGHGSGWCAKCVPKEPQPVLATPEKAKRWLDKFIGT